MPQQNVDVPTKLYSKMNSVETFLNEIGQQVEKTQNKTFDNKNLYTKTLSKMNDLLDFWDGVAHSGFSIRNIILINKIKVFVYDGKNTLDTRK